MSISLRKLRECVTCSVVVDGERIRANIRARKVAEELITMIDTMVQADTLTEDRLYELLAEEFAARVAKQLVPDGSNVTTMTLEHAVAFEETRLPFGTYEGDTVRNVSNDDPDELFLLHDNLWRRTLGRYIRSNHFRSKLKMLAISFHKEV